MWICSTYVVKTKKKLYAFTWFTFLWLLLMPNLKVVVFFWKLIFVVQFYESIWFFCKDKKQTVETINIYYALQEKRLKASDIKRLFEVNKKSSLLCHFLNSLFKGLTSRYQFIRFLSYFTLFDHLYWHWSKPKNQPSKFTWLICPFIYIKVVFNVDRVYIQTPSLQSKQLKLKLYQDVDVMEIY